MEKDDLLIDSVINETVLNNEISESTIIVEDTKKKNKKNKKGKSKITEVTTNDVISEEPILNQNIEKDFNKKELEVSSKPVILKPLNKKTNIPLKVKKHKLLKSGKRTIKSYNYPTTAKFKRNKSVNKNSISTSFKILSSGSIRI